MFHLLGVEMWNAVAGPDGLPAAVIPTMQKVVRAVGGLTSL